MEAAIELKHVKKKYTLGEVEIEVLKGVNLRVDEGEFVSIMGPSGSGKSTMLHLLGALDKPSEGSVHIDGTDITSMNDNQLASIRGKKIGFIFQSFNLVPRLSSLENVMLPMWFADTGGRKEKAEKLLEKVGLSHRKNNLPSQLSGGERQRVAIARSLANDPKIIVADEPTGNLDSKRGSEILDILTEIHEEGGTLIIVTHDTRIAKKAERRIMMMDGRIVHKKVI